MNEIIHRLSPLPAEAMRNIAAYQDQACSETPRYEPMDKLIAVLERIPALAALYEREGFGTDTLVNTLSDVAIWARFHFAQSGRWGITVTEWLTHHMDGELFKLKRLQFIPRVFPYNFRLYRRNRDGVAVAFPEEPIVYRGDGQVSGTNGIFEDGFTGGRQERSVGGRRFAEGVPISPHGHAENRVVRLWLDAEAPDAWTLALAKGMPALELHVPEEPGFTVEACRASLLAIRDFSVRHKDYLYSWIKPDIPAAGAFPFAAVYISSWLMDRQLENLLPSGSNIPGFLREFYLAPTLSNAEPAMERVFHDAQFDPFHPTQEQTRTGLQRAIAAFMREGGKMRWNTGFIASEDLPFYGTAPYRERYAQHV